MAESKPIALWCVPRSLSTAFERVFEEREDFEVLHEPFSASYYYSEDRPSDRYRDEEPKPEHNYENVLANIFRQRERRVFLKDMAYQAQPLLGPEFASRFVNTFLIRDPKYVISSLYKMWPTVTFEETGYEHLYEMYRYATREGQDPLVVDAMTFSENPVGVLRTYCGRLGIPFEEDSLSWASGEVSKWKSWEGWHDAAEQSTGIQPAKRRDPELPGRLMDVYERCLPYYYQLAAHVIPATPRKSSG